MHPNEKVLDVSFHRSGGGMQRRRSSLDNSCLAATDSFVALLPEDEKGEFSNKKERRLSLGTKLEDTNTTFLAFANQQSSSQKHKEDLDADQHNSLHGSPTTSRWRPSSHSKTSDTKDTINTSSYSSAEEEPAQEEDEAVANTAAFEVDSDESSLDDDSDCDSFCDASDDEPANRTYLRADLGASVMWSDVESLDGGGSLDHLQDSWGGGSSGDCVMGGNDSFSRSDSPPGKPRRTLSGGPKSNAFRAPSSPRRAPLRNYSFGSSAVSASPVRSLRRNYSSSSASVSTPTSPGRRTRRHLAAKQTTGSATDEGAETQDVPLPGEL